MEALNLAKKEQARLNLFHRVTRDNFRAMETRNKQRDLNKRYLEEELKKLSTEGDPFTRNRKIMLAKISKSTDVQANRSNLYSSLVLPNIMKREFETEDMIENAVKSQNQSMLSMAEKREMDRRRAMNNHSQYLRTQIVEKNLFRNQAHTETFQKGKEENIQLQKSLFEEKEDMKMAKAEQSRRHKEILMKQMEERQQNIGSLDQMDSRVVGLNKQDIDVDHLLICRPTKMDRRIVSHLQILY